MLYCGEKTITRAFHFASELWYDLGIMQTTLDLPRKFINIFDMMHPEDFKNDEELRKTCGMIDGKDIKIHRVRANSVIGSESLSSKIKCAAVRFNTIVLTCGLCVEWTPLYLARGSETAQVEVQSKCVDYVPLRRFKEKQHGFRHAEVVSKRNHGEDGHKAHPREADDGEVIDLTEVDALENHLIELFSEDNNNDNNDGDGDGDDDDDGGCVEERQLFDDSKGDSKEDNNDNAKLFQHLLVKNMNFLISTEKDRNSRKESKMNAPLLMKEIRNILKEGPNMCATTKIKQLKYFDRLYNAYMEKKLKPSVMAYYLHITKEYRKKILKQLQAEVAAGIDEHVPDTTGLEEVDLKARLGKFPGGWFIIGDKGFICTGIHYPEAVKALCPAILYDSDNKQYTEDQNELREKLYSLRYTSESSFSTFENRFRFTRDNIERSQFAFVEAAIAMVHGDNNIQVVLREPAGYTQFVEELNSATDNAN